MMRKYHVRFGGGPMEKYRRNRWQLAGGLPNPSFARVAADSPITVLRTPVRAPRANATCERFLGSVRRECPDHVLALGEAHLRRVLREYAGCFNQHRPHQGCQHQVRDAPAGGTPPPGRSERVGALPILGGLHHPYQRAA